MEQQIVKWVDILQNKKVRYTEFSFKQSNNRNKKLKNTSMTGHGLGGF